MIGGTIPSGCCKTGEGCLDDGHELGPSLGPRLAVVLPAEFRTHHSASVGDSDLLVLGSLNAAGQSTHEVETAVGEGAFALEAQYLRLHLLTHPCLGFARRARCPLESG